MEGVIEAKFSMGSNKRLYQKATIERQQQSVYKTWIYIFHHENL